MVVAGLTRMRAARRLSLLATLVALAAPRGAHALELVYDHDLSTPVGKLRAQSPLMSVDAYTGELYVFGTGDHVRIFNPAGMQVFAFGEAAEIGGVFGVAGLPGGDLVLLAAKDLKVSLLRATYRGEVIGPFELSGVPPDLAGFTPGRLLEADGKLFVVDTGGMRLLVVTQAGAYVASYDLAEMMGFADKRKDLGISGCRVSRNGTFLFTVAPIFKVGVLAPGGLLRVFGEPGGAPGKFNVVAGVDADDEGRIYVSDALRSTVSVFDADADFAFLGQFGARGTGPGSFSSPGDVVVADGKLYVAQSRARGVTVFRIVAEPRQATATTPGG
jgi:DNA-binding beta-propeller fold protein YncE